MDRDNVLDLIQTIQKKDRVIELMVDKIYIDNYLSGEFSNKEEIKQYFYKKLEEQQ